MQNENAAGGACCNPAAVPGLGVSSRLWKHGRRQAAPAALKGGARVVRTTCLSVVPLAVALVLAGQGFGLAQGTSTELPERFRAFATNLGDIPTTADNRQIEIRIDRWSSPKEGELLLTTLKEHGERALLDVLQDRPNVGSIMSQGSLAYPLKYAMQEPWGDGGRQITLLTDRYIAFWEVAGGSRTRDYPFSVIKLNLKHDGTGEGTMSLATKISMEAGILVFEEFATRPIRLMAVTKEK